MSKQFRIEIRGSHNEDSSRDLRTLVDQFVADLGPRGYHDITVNVLRTGFEATKGTERSEEPQRQSGSAGRPAPTNPNAPRMPGGDRDPANPETLIDRAQDLEHEALTAAVEAHESLEGLTVSDLRALAKERGLTGFSKLKKPELIQALLDNAIAG